MRATSQTPVSSQANSLHNRLEIITSEHTKEDRNHNRPSFDKSVVFEKGRGATKVTFCWGEEWGTLGDEWLPVSAACQHGGADGLGLRGARSTTTGKKNTLTLICSGLLETRPNYLECIKMSAGQRSCRATHWETVRGCCWGALAARR